ncbi:SusC/RagA family TonB-linked outer membrane protein [Gillisia sp. CAL575]|uniref:SusC/RagA family TonB-linked outer membrane protein n=1 Tax=Gillisia sp. CAL575 TaxID=985255 RepID=UPI0003A3155F|nr:TonB-dependent receptor [Gillisia sp. CAL575]
MKTKFTLLFVLLNLFYFQLQAQDQLISGTVTSEPDGVTLPGVNVLVKGTSKGTITDFDGNYSISANENDTLIFSFLGFETIEESVGARNNINILMAESASSLGEVVLVGYGSTRKQDVTGSITRINAEELIKQPALTPTQSLQGKAAGVQIISSGAPGSSPVVRIRGTGTVQAGRDPIYVVDGIITDRIDNISSEDITTIDILKDASSLAIYGTRGANGVIIVTTKAGKIGKMQVDVSSYYGVKDVLSKVDMANSSSFVNFSNLAFGFQRFDQEQQYDTDWFEEITRMGTVTNHNVSISGGTEKMTSYFSANYFEEEGVLIGNDYRRLNLRSKASYNLTSKLKFDHNISLSLNRSVPKPFSAFTTAYKQSPIVPVRYIGGSFDGRFGVPFDNSGGRFNNVGNAVADLELNDEKKKNLILQGNVSATYDFTDYLTGTARFGIESGYGKSYVFTPNLEQFLAADPTREVSDFDSPNRNTLRVRKDDFYHWVFDAFLTFDKTFVEKHGVKITLGTTAEEEQNDFLEGTRNNVPENSNLFSLNNGEQGTDIVSNALSDTRRLRSYFARLNYDFDNKYLLTATIRRDGSSVFANTDEKWGNFPSVGIGWLVSNEEFLSNSNFLNTLKLRASWGQLGNQNIPLNALTFNTDLGAVFGPDQVLVPGSTITAIIDENVGWEVTEEYDIGVEFAFLDNRLSGEFDYYDRLNKNAILPISLPDAFGASGLTLTHAGKIRNKGLEFALHWNDKINEDFNYHFSGNITTNDNQLEEITNPFAFEQQGGSIDNGQVTKLLREGQPLGSFFLLEVEGFDERGDFVYRDLNNDGEIDNDDRQFFGSIQPDIFYGISAGFDYKNWDFNIEGYGNAGSMVYNGKKAQRFGGENIEASAANNIFSFDNGTNMNPAPSNEVPLSSTYFLESGDFFRINNITFGYTLPDVFTGVKKIRVYALAQNPFIFKEFTGFTPELPGNGDPLGSSGIELNAYPSVKSYIVGVNLNF